MSTKATNSAVDPTELSTNQDGLERRQEEKSSLRRELLAIFVLYLIGAILPLLIGLMFGPSAGGPR